MTMSPTETCWSVRMSVRRTDPSAEPTSWPWARLDCTMAETPELSSVMRRTVALVGPTSLTWPMTPAELVTGMPTAMPEVVPLSMVIVEVHESVDCEMTVAAVESRL